MNQITKEQIKTIHILKNRNNVSDDYYRVLLGSKFNKPSCKDLTEAQASVLISLLKRLGTDLATDKQIGKFNVLFKKCFKEKDKAEFIRRQLGKGKNEKNMTVKECSKLIYELEQIIDWQRKRKELKNER